MTFSKITRAFLLTIFVGWAGLSTSVPAWSYTATEVESDISAFFSQLPVDGVPKIGTVDVSGVTVTATDISLSFSGEIKLNLSMGNLIMKRTN